MTKSRARTPPKWPASQVTRWPIERIRPYARNARRHSLEQVEQIANSIREWGWTMPLLADETDTLIAGHARLQAARMLNIPEVPVMVARGWSPAQIRAYVIADNQLASNSDWSQELLIKEVGELAASKHDLTLLGFTAAELRDLTELDREFNAEAEIAPRAPSPSQLPECYRAIAVHFRSEADLRDFERIIGRPITAKHQWHPEPP